MKLSGIKEYAIKSHSDTNHLYDGKPYSVHLEMVAETAQQFIKLIPVDDWELVYGACYCHDTIEDCRVTINDLYSTVGIQVAELVYALTNEKGRNRKERANSKYYEGIRNTPYATFVKLCDRIANVKYGLSINSRMVQMYAQENNAFRAVLYDPKYKEMFDYLSELLGKVVGTQEISQ